MNDKDKARQKAAIILAVRSGKMTAKDGAKQLGISRKTYYQWEKRALTGMLTQLEEKEVGRPETEVDLEKQRLMAKVAELEKKLEIACQTAEIRGILAEIERTKKKKRK